MSHLTNSEKGSGLSTAESSSFRILSGLQTHGIIQHQRQIRNAISIKSLYAGLYSKSHAAKILRVARACLAQDVSLNMLSLEKLVNGRSWPVLT
jgi:hypothetical protein